MHVLQPWSSANPIETRLVPGGGYPDPFWSNPFAIEAVPNVLFLPDGFPASAESAFYSYVNSLVGFLKRDPLCKPYDKLAHSINFWAAFIPSPQGAITWGLGAPHRAWDFVALGGEGRSAFASAGRGPMGDRGDALRARVAPAARRPVEHRAHQRDDHGRVGRGVRAELPLAHRLDRRHAQRAGQQLAESGRPHDPRRRQHAARDHQRPAAHRRPAQHLLHEPRPHGSRAPRRPDVRAAPRSLRRVGTAPRQAVGGQDEAEL